MVTKTGTMFVINIPLCNQKQMIYYFSEIDITILNMQMCLLSNIINTNITLLKYLTWSVSFLLSIKVTTNLTVQVYSSSSWLRVLPVNKRNMKLDFNYTTF